MTFIIPHIISVLYILLWPQNTVKSAYKEPAYKELLVIRNWFLFPSLYTYLVRYTFIRNSGYKEHVFLVLISSI